MPSSRRSPGSATSTPTCLPVTFDRPGVLAQGLAERLGRLSDALGALDPQAVADAQASSFLQGRVTSPLGGSLLDRMALADLAGDTPLRRRPGRACVLQPDGDRLHLLLGDRRVTVPARITTAVEQLRGLLELTPDDLDLDPASSLVLCRRLVREGLLEVRR